MDALILSCGTGGGHNSAGEAIEQALCQRPLCHEAEPVSFEKRKDRADGQQCIYPL